VFFQQGVRVHRSKNRKEQNGEREGLGTEARVREKTNTKREEMVRQALHTFGGKKEQGEGKKIEAQLNEKKHDG